MINNQLVVFKPRFVINCQQKLFGFFPAANSACPWSVD
jgi:hypothetical protein